MRLLTSKGSDLSSCFDKNGDNTPNINKVLTQISINNHAIEANKGKIEGVLSLKFSDFAKTFKKITKNLSFHMTFKTANLQVIIFTIIASDINAITNSLYLYIPYINFIN